MENGKKKIITAIVANIIVWSVVIIMITCNGKVPQDTTDTSGVKDEYMHFVEPTEEQLSNGGLNYYMIVKGYNSSYWDTLIQGAVDAASGYDINLFVAGVAQESNTERLAKLIEEAISKEPDAIIIAPVDTARINDLVDVINEKDIPLIFVDTILNGQNFDACYMTDNIQAGQTAAKDMLEKLVATGYKETDSISVGIEIGSKQSQTVIERLAGVNEYWANNAPANWKIIDSIKVNDASSDIAYEQTIEFMNENSNLAGLFGLNNGSTVGICRGVSEKERKDIVIVGFDYSDDIARLIEGGEYQVSTMVQRQYNMGYGSINAAYDISCGKEIKSKYINTGITRVDHDNYNNTYITQNILRK